MEWKGIPTVIFGAGGMAKDVYYAIHVINDSNFQPTYDILGFVGKDSREKGKIKL